MYETRENGMDIDFIYFDMDGVLVDFKRGQREILNIEVVDQEHKRGSSEKLMVKSKREVNNK